MQFFISFLYFMTLNLLINQIISCVINQNIQRMYSGDQNSDSYDSSSSEEKKYFCFCDKLFATYSGLYQHIKSKHPNLFPTYKKMKLQKMLKKSRDSRGTYSYKLIKMAEENIHFDSSAQKIKRNTQSSQSRMRQKLINMPQNEENRSKQKKMPETVNRQKQSKIESRIRNNQIFSKNNQLSQQAPKQFSDPYMGFPAQMPPYPPPFPHYMPNMFPHFPPYYPEFRLTIKGFLVRFLYQSPEFNKEQTKAYLYDLMVFIDKNVPSLKDPRTKGRLFLSYCDEFDPQYSGPLIYQFIEKLESCFKENITQYNEEQHQNKKLQIDCIKAFGEWLNEAGLLKLEKEFKSQIKTTELHEFDQKEKEI